MMNKRIAAMSLGLMLALAMTGCGNRLPANPPIDPDAEASAAPAASPAPEASTAPVTPAATTPAYQQPLTGSLVVSNVDKKKVGGFLGMAKKLEVKGTVINTSNVPLSGKVIVKFTKKTGIINKKMEPVGDPKEVVVAQLAPGASFPFDVTSEKSCDEAEYSVETTPAAGATTTAAVSNPYGAPATATAAHVAGPYGY
jgi:hypothetical protein